MLDAFLDASNIQCFRADQNRPMRRLLSVLLPALPVATSAAPRTCLVVGVLQSDGDGGAEIEAKTKRAGLWRDAGTSATWAACFRSVCGASRFGSGCTLKYFTAGRSFSVPCANGDGEASLSSERTVIDALKRHRFRTESTSMMRTAPRAFHHPNGAWKSRSIQVSTAPSATTPTFTEEADHD